MDGWMVGCWTLSPVPSMGTVHLSGRRAALLTSSLKAAGMGPLQHHLDNPVVNFPRPTNICPSSQPLHRLRVGTANSATTLPCCTTT